MIQNFLAKILMAPFSLLYGFGVEIRNFLYKRKWLKGIEFDLPLISVGNLSIGGAGKSPHIEYLIILLRPYLNVSTLSRGYKRKTKGYLEVAQSDNAEKVGDEPLQFKRKFPDVFVAVAENRTFAIPKILMKKEDMQVVLLDDAFQHRAIIPGLNILLTEYEHPFTRDFLLPSGRLREWRSSYTRADIIIVSKCPPVISQDDKDKLIQEIKPLTHQKLFFSYYEYGSPYYLFNGNQRIKLTEDVDVILICAIARTDYLMNWLVEQVNSVKLLEYEDHRYFTKYDIGHTKKVYDNHTSKKKVIITTEKDAMRLQLHREFLVENKLPIFVLPIKVAFHFDEGEVFDEEIKQFLLEFKV